MIRHFLEECIHDKLLQRTVMFFHDAGLKLSQSQVSRSMTCAGKLRGLCACNVSDHPRAKSMICNVNSRGPPGTANLLVTACRDYLFATCAAVGGALWVPNCMWTCVLDFERASNCENSNVAVFEEFFDVRGGPSIPLPSHEGEREREGGCADVTGFGHRWWRSVVDLRRRRRCRHCHQEQSCWFRRRRPHLVLQPGEMFEPSGCSPV